jgi:taurine dioxygenase
MTASLEIIPLDAPLGALVKGEELRIDGGLDAATLETLRDAVDEYLLLLFRGIDLPSAEALNAFCLQWGPLRPTLADKSRLPGFPGINRISNRDENGVVGTGGRDIVTWHSDLAFVPPLIERIYLDAVAIPSTGGNTKWVNLVAAYEALDEATRERIDGVAVDYRLRDGLDFRGYFKAEDPAEATRDQTRISLVQTNPRNGRKAVWPNAGPDFATHVVGMSEEEGSELLASLYDHVTQDRFVYEHEWCVGDIMLWLNNQTLHQREAFPAEELRVLRHVNILGLTDPAQQA